MRYFIGDLGNTANQLVLCSVILAIVMQVMCEVFRARSVSIMATLVSAVAMRMAGRYYWWAIGFQRGSLVLLCLALVTQQIRLQVVKEMALRDGIATATSVLSIRDVSTGGISGKLDQSAADLVDAWVGEDDGKTTTVTTPGGITVSWNSTNRARDNSMPPTTAGHDRCGENDRRRGIDGRNRNSNDRPGLSATSERDGAIHGLHGITLGGGTGRVAGRLNELSTSLNQRALVER